MASAMACSSDVPVRQDWVYRFDSDDARRCGISYAHMCNLEAFTYRGEAVVAAAFQCSGAGAEGGDSQHLRFATSRDAGATWSDARCVMWGLNALWSPILHYDASAGVLHLFYSESRKARSPGGDVKCLTSVDAGETWSDVVRTVYTHEADGGVPKVLANKLIVVDDEWILPFWREPVDSWIEYQHYHPLQENEQGREPRPDIAPLGLASPPESREGSAGVLISRDRGVTWEAHGRVRDDATWLIENTLCEIAQDKSLVMLFRTGTGRVYRSISTDRGKNWTSATPTSLPNPNSKVGMTCVHVPGTEKRSDADTSPSKETTTKLIVAYNASQRHRAPLHLATSEDGGDTWTDAAVLEADPMGNFAYPTPIAVDADGGGVDVMVGYSVWGQGIRVATVRM